MEFLRDRVVPAITALTALAMGSVTVLLASKGEIGAAACTLALTGAIALFVVHDVNRLRK